MGVSRPFHGMQCPISLVLPKWGNVISAVLTKSYSAAANVVPAVVMMMMMMVMQNVVPAGVMMMMMMVMQNVVPAGVCHSRQCTP